MTAPDLQTGAEPQGLARLSPLPSAAADLHDTPSTADVSSRNREWDTASASRLTPEEKTALRKAFSRNLCIQMFILFSSARATTNRRSPGWWAEMPLGDHGSRLTSRRRC